MSTTEQMDDLVAVLKQFNNADELKTLARKLDPTLATHDLSIRETAIELALKVITDVPGGQYVAALISTAASIEDYIRNGNQVGE